MKLANPHLSSVCEIGSIVGSLWRDLSVEDKDVYNQLFAKDKVGCFSRWDEIKQLKVIQN